MRGTSRRMVVWGAMAMVVVLGTGACSSGGKGGTAGGKDTSPITIGVSLPLTGPVADVALGGRQGYQAWVDQVNKQGGLLGRKVKLVVLDDGFDQGAVVSNYNKLIGQQKVDLVFGALSSLLNGPASAIAERQKYLYVEPSGGDATLFTRGFKYLFFAQPGTTESLPNQFVSTITAMSAADRPKTAAYLTADDPSASPAVKIFKDKLSALGIKTVYDQTYAPDTKSFDSLASAVAGAKPDLVIQGSLAEDGVAFNRGLQKVGFSPKMMFQTNVPADPAYPKNVGKGNENGIFTAAGWSPSASYPSNRAFVAAFSQKYGQSPSEDAANSYTVGQVVGAAVEGVGSIDDQKALADWLHAHTVDTVVGPLKWDSTGVPLGSLLLDQWQNHKLEVVAPAKAATVQSILNPKPGWTK